MERASSLGQSVIAVKLGYQYIYYTYQLVTYIFRGIKSNCSIPGMSSLSTQIAATC